MAFSDFHWVNPEGIPGDDFEQLRGYPFLSLDGASKLFAGSGKTPEDLFHAARESRPLSPRLGECTTMPTSTRE